MKKRSCAALAIVGAILISSCGSDSSSGSAGSDACKPVKKGVLSVVTGLPGPNFWGTSKAEIDPDSINSGIEYDLATLIAKKCGLKMEFRNEAFEALVAGQIVANTYDLALSQVTITEERAKVVDFSVGYFKSDQGLLVAKGTTAATWDDVKKLTIGVQTATTAEYYFASGEVAGWQLPNVKVFPDLFAAYAALSAGQVDGVIIDTPINLGQASQSAGKQEVIGQFKTGEEYGAIYGLGNGKKAIFDPIIQGFIDDGTVNGLIAKYLGGDPSTVPFIEIPTS